MDVFLEWDGVDRDPNRLAAALQPLNAEGLGLVMVTNRGTKVWPDGMSETFCTDHWRCRFEPARGDTAVTHAQIAALLQRVDNAGLDCIKTENLYTFDGQPGYSRGQGQ